MAQNTTDLPAVFVQNITAKRQTRETGKISIFEGEKQLVLLFNDRKFIIDKNSYLIYPKLDQDQENGLFCVRFNDLSYLKFTANTKLIKTILDGIDYFQ